MAFQDRSKENVQSLLALLRSTQDDSPGTEPQPNSPPTPSSIPSKRQLDELLSSLGSKSQTYALAASSNTPPSVSPRPRQLIEPFGPVGQLAGPSRLPFDPQSRPSLSSTFHERTPLGSARNNGGREELNLDTLSFAKSLPIITELLGTEFFTEELRKMKVDQDALERRLWAKQEKVKAEHERGVKAEKDIARIARRPIPPEKEAQWADTLATNLDDFYRQTCLTSMDGLGMRQRNRLCELGVPGLGGEDGEKSLERLRRVMDLLEAGMEE